MSRASVVAIGAVSPLGIGEGAYRVGSPGEPPRSALATDPVLAGAGLARPFSGRAPADPGGPPLADRAAALLAAALGQALATLDDARPGWRGERVGIALGTSSGGMLSAERFFVARASGAADAVPAIARAATYFAPLDEALAAFGLGAPGGALVAKRVQVLSACAASTIAIGLGLRWLERGACDLVLAGGYDGLGVFVACGFEALRATTASRPRPFRVGRDGMSLGEGAGVIAMVRGSDARGARASFHVEGFGTSTDAVHITAPDRTGAGLSRAAEAALADAGLPASAIELVSAHATATPFNDTMEARALARALGPGSRPVVHPFKAQIGHTLGAAGVLESLAAADALARGIAPAAAGDGELDPESDVRLLERSEPASFRAALKLSAAFGGTNAALVLIAGDPPPGSPGKVSSPDVPRTLPGRAAPRGGRAVHLRAFAGVDSVDTTALSEATGVPRDRLGRLDALCRLGLGAAAALAGVVGRERLAGAGIVAGHALATLDTNDGFDRRRRERGARAVDPRVFPATSPNALGGEIAIVYQLTGPSCAVSSGLDGATEALATAAELVAAGDADRILVVAADDAGPAARDLLRAAGWGDRSLRPGAVALLLDAQGDGALAVVDPDLPIDHARRAIGHLALIEWLETLPTARGA